jgi:hypothetical protein
MDKQLVSFGNYLLKEYGVMVHSSDGKNVPIYQREVSHADICNWKDEYLLVEKPVELPSQHQVGDKVLMCLMPEGHDEDSFPGIPAVVNAVHFYRGKVKYDLELRFIGGDSTRIYNIDSVFVLKK